jgi:trans-aconitate methyltransferase
MITAVGKQEDLFEAVKQLLELDYDAMDAYQVAINNITDTTHKNKLLEFKQDHQRHVDQLSDFLSSQDIKAPVGPDNTKCLLAKGKVYLASIIGDKNILQAILSNEHDTNVAYQRMYDRTSKDDNMHKGLYEIIYAGLKDEKSHKEWLTKNT